MCDRRPERIGLSATQRPIDTVGRLLAGERLPPAVVDVGHQRDLDVAIELPDGGDRGPPCGVDPGGTEFIDYRAAAYLPGLFAAVAGRPPAHVVGVGIVANIHDGSDAVRYCRVRQQGGRVARNGKFVIKRGRGGTTHFVLLASNAKVVATSETDESKESSLEGFAAVIEEEPTAAPKAAKRAAP